MPAITTKHFDGGTNLTPKASSGKRDEDLAAALRAAVDDIAELRTQFIAALAKLDADAGVTDINYESTLTPAAQTLTKG